jgi:2-amino-4-hydroxy-6-hydroxymethyldihydropteridine diphosphokinase
LQLPYCNAVIEVGTDETPRALMRILKAIERRAGRRTGRMWGPRSLDLDLVDYGGALMGNPRRTHRTGQLVLPHPELHKRAFVLVPLLEIAPDWRHPRSRKAGKTLLRELALPVRRGIGGSLAFSTPACEKAR